MRHIDNIPIDMILILIAIIGAVAIPAALGFVLTAMYRKVRPLPTAQEINLATLGDKQKDGFFTFLIVGWAVCGPLLYWFYPAHLFGSF